MPGHIPSEWEMYDLASDPEELVNLAHHPILHSPEHRHAYERLRGRLEVVKQTRLQPLA